EIRERDVPVDLDTEDVVQEKAEPSSAAELVIELEGLIVARECAVSAELELVRMLRAQSPGCANHQHPKYSDYPHGTTPRIAFREEKNATQNRKFVRKTRYPFGLSL